MALLKISGLFALVMSIMLLTGGNAQAQTEADISDQPCFQILAVAKMISDAIEKGAPTYNEGNHKGCYKIYKKTAKKILKKYGGNCPNVTLLLGAGLAKAKYYDKTPTEQAWSMRFAFDSVLGVETVTQ